MGNELSLNNNKTKNTLFRKKSAQYDLLLKLLVLKIEDKNTKRKSAIKFLGVILDENITWE